MEEILASIRRIIADDEPAKPAPPVAEAGARCRRLRHRLRRARGGQIAAMGQDDIDALLSGFDDKPEPAPSRSADVLELTDAVPLPAAAKANGFAASSRGRT